MNRRSFVRLAAAGCVGWHGHLASAASFTAAPDARKLILVVFGGGARSSETIADPEHRHVPGLGREMVPQGTLFANVRVEHRVVHPNANASIKTGHWEWDDLDWSRPPAHPTIFEIVRKHRDLPDTAAWAFVYASILANTGGSASPGYGPRYAANVVEAPTIPRSTAEAMERRMAQARSSGSPEAEQEAAADCARLARQTSRIATGGLRSGPARQWLDEQFRAWQQESGSTSHDAFLTRCALACMERFAPDVMSVDFGEIDCAHYGSWSRYVEAIRRTDELTWRLWQAAQTLRAYRGRTVFLVLPDHGRELDRPGQSGFVHHSDFYTNQGADEGCRRVWMLVLGAGVAAGRLVERPIPITAAAGTALASLGLEPSPGAARSAWEE
jgi:hypothetical protein